MLALVSFSIHFFSSFSSPLAITLLGGILNKGIEGLLSRLLILITSPANFDIARRAHEVGVLPSEWSRMANNPVEFPLTSIIQELGVIVVLGFLPGA